MGKSNAEHDQQRPEPLRMSSIAVGCGIGVVVSAVFPRGVLSASTELTVDGLMGMGAALAFWLVWRRSQTEQH